MAASLVQEIREELAPVRDQLLAHGYVAAVEEGLIQLEQLQPFACEQSAIISSDVRSVAHLASRFAGDFETPALAVIEAGLQRGVPERRIRRAARLLQGYELLYWDTLLGELQR